MARHVALTACIACDNGQYRRDSGVPYLETFKLEYKARLCLLKPAVAIAAPLHFKGTITFVGLRRVWNSRARWTVGSGPM